jgi:FixJ family two-component response regulator
MSASSAPEPPIVYVVEDDEAVRQSLAFTLDLEGYRVESCRTGESLLAKALPTSDAFLLLDERLPGLGGLETLTRLRAQGVGLPAALVTSHPPPALRASARAAGVPILEKPLLFDTLIAAVRQGLSSAAHG